MKRFITASCAVLSVAGITAGCDTERALRGPLAQVAYTVLSYGLECNEVDHWPVPVGQPPFQDCRGTVRDSTMLVVSDASDSAVVVSRRWAVGGDGEQEYSELLAALQQQYGEGVFVPPPIGGEHADRLMTVWTFGTHHLRLRLMPTEGYIFMQWELGPPEY